MQTHAVKHRLSVLHFQTQALALCANVKFIQKIISLAYLEILPGAPNYVVGLLNLAGKSIPIIDLGIRLGFNRQEDYSVDAPIILCNTAAQWVGLVVDEICGIENIDSKDLQMETEFKDEESLIKATLTLNTKTTLLLNMPKVLKINLAGLASPKVMKATGKKI